MTDAHVCVECVVCACVCVCGVPDPYALLRAPRSLEVPDPYALLRAPRSLEWPEERVLH